MATCNRGPHKHRFLGGVPVTALVKRVLSKAWADDCLGKGTQLSYAFLFASFLLCSFSRRCWATAAS